MRDVPFGMLLGLLISPAAPPWREGATRSATSLLSLPCGQSRGGYKGAEGHAVPLGCQHRVSPWGWGLPSCPSKG